MYRSSRAPGASSILLPESCQPHYTAGGAARIVAGRAPAAPGPVVRSGPMSLHPSRLTALPAFKGVPMADLTELCRYVYGRHVLRGEVLYEEDAPATDACLLLSGRLSVRLADGKVVGDLWPGELVGDAALFDTQGRRNATVFAVMDSECAVIEPQLFALLPHNRAVVAIEEHLLASMARRIRAANARLEQTWRPEAPEEPKAGAAEPKKTGLRDTILRILGVG